MTSDENRKWRERARFCIQQAAAIQRTLPPRREWQPKTMDELSVSFLHDFAANIIKGLSKND